MIPIWKAEGIRSQQAWLWGGVWQGLWAEVILQPCCRPHPEELMLGAWSSRPPGLPRAGPGLGTLTVELGQDPSGSGLWASAKGTGKSRDHEPIRGRHGRPQSPLLESQICTFAPLGALPVGA